jgi:2-polyprenyl-3-methyl-5-hydroxy-6-metoxy-1,4-benzoquinol methylase
MEIQEFVKKFNFDECVFNLLKSIEQDNKRIKDIIINKYLENPISSNEEEYLLNYFINNSVFSAATVANPATSVVTEFLYAQPEQIHFIDQYFFESKGGKAINSRLFCVEKNIHELIETQLQKIKKRKVLIANLGGGLGRDVCNILSKYYQDNENIETVVVDKDKVALKRGKRIAEAGGVKDKIEFIENSFMRYKPSKKFDIIILVGVLCGLPQDVCVRILKNTRKMLNNGGYIMTSNASIKMLEEDPFTYFIMEKITGWKIVFKTEEDLKEIIKKAGFKWQKSFTDDFGFHIMPIGLK